MLGPLRLVRDGQALTRFGTQKAAALLAYLALRSGPQPREHLLELFWPDMDLTAGRNNLNTALSSLRRCLEPPGVRRGDVLVTTHAHAGLSPAAATDVAEFERLLRRAEAAPDPEPRAVLLRQALTLYAGDFQPGNYQDWAVRESERLSACRVEALDRLGGALETLGRCAEAAAVTQQRLDADPYAEQAYVDLVRRQVRAGQTPMARKSSANFERFFREEFGTAPSAETRRAVEAIFANDAPAAGPPLVSPRRAADIAAPERGIATKGEAMAVAPLPFWLSRFFGRDAETDGLASLLLRSKAALRGRDLPEHGPRLVTVIGPGGVGKTRLAAEFARLASEQAGHWCGFVPLADLPTADRIPAQIAQALRLPPSPAAPPLDQIVAFFRDRDRPGTPPPLLLLDNMEHLLPEAKAGTDVGSHDAAETVRSLLARIPGLTVLCTSRRRLGLQGECLVPLVPLPVPEASAGDAWASSVLLQVPSVRLYVDRAQAVRPDFGLTPSNAPAVAALCRALEGSPLALELAASWVRLLPPRKMWERLSAGQGVPVGEYADLPPRHRSLEAALDWSWRLLTEPQRRLLARVSVFRGGWTLEAAQEVGAAPNALELMSGLQEASLVTVRESESGEIRYGLLDSVRRFADGRLAAQDTEHGCGGAPLRARHLAWCLALAERAEPEMTGPDQKAWLSGLETEHDNLRAALDWSETQPEAAEVRLRLAAALGKFWTVRGHLTEGRRRLDAALQGAAGVPPWVQAKALYEAGALANAQSDGAEARRRLEQCLLLRSEIGDAGGCAAALRLLGIGARQRGDHPAARTLLTESLAQAQAAGDKQGIVAATTSLGNLALAVGDLEAAQDLYARSLPLYRANGDRRGCAVALGNLGNVSSALGDHCAAQTLLAECFAIYTELGDQRGGAITQQSQATVSYKQGDSEAAMTQLWECLRVYRALEDRLAGVDCLDDVAVLLAERGQPARAAYLRAAAAALRHQNGIRLSAARQEEDDQAVRGLRQALGETAFRQAWAVGQTMTAAEATEYALEDTASAPPRPCPVDDPSTQGETTLLNRPWVHKSASEISGAE